MGGMARPTMVPSMASDPNDFSYRYNTRLTPEEELEFQKSDIAKDVYDYDARGAFREMKAGTMSRDGRGHLGDKYKKPNHHTFSNESIYHGKDGYEGGVWVKNENGQYVKFIPGSTNVHSKEALERYFREREPEIQLDDRRKHGSRRPKT